MNRSPLQFRSDDEVVTLVLSCPTHGTEYNAVHKYRKYRTDCLLMDDKCVYLSGIEKYHNIGSRDLKQMIRDRRFSKGVAHSVSMTMMLPKECKLS